MNPKNFTAFDVETPTLLNNTICSLGIVKVENSEIVYSKEFLIQPPENKYTYRNIDIHGITPLLTENSPSFDKVWPNISKFFDNQFIVAHNISFDINVLTKTLDFYKLTIPAFKGLLCTYEITGYALDVACKCYNIELNHHNALSDAIACAKLFIKASHPNVFSPDRSIVDSYNKKSSSPITYHEKIRSELLKPDFENCDQQNPFYRKKVVISGVFDNYSRNDLARILKEKGADIDTDVTKRTNYLIVGKKFGPSKYAKAKKYSVHIISEDDFIKMIK
ncbi:MAG: 3'-5' exoribonuclease [Bacteroidales bacterium]|nr:3'-5' exoribonuclease [Bacteroidales bacterium]